jgi:glutamate-1-semialdehyde 2,1-aminomutase
MPVGAYGGRKEVMKQVSPVGPVYQAGTLSGNPVAMACGIATLKTLRDENPYPRLADRAARLGEGIAAAATRHGFPPTLARVGSMFTYFFNDEAVSNFTVAQRSDTSLFARYFWGMLERGVYLPCSQFEANFVSAAHSDADIDRTIAAADEVFAVLATSA